MSKFQAIQTIWKIGNSLVVTVPKAFLLSLNIEEGDRIKVIFEKDEEKIDNETPKEM